MMCARDFNAQASVIAGRKPWYEDRRNVAALYRWLMAESALPLDSQVVSILIESPDLFEDEWREMQESLMPPTQRGEVLAERDDANG